MSAASAFVSSEMTVNPSWIDYNGHLNMAYYHVLLDRASDEFWSQFGLGPDYVKATGHSTFAAECHIRYIKELQVHDPVRVTVHLVGADAKRLHTFRELRHARDGWLAAASENMSLHVDLNLRKVVPFSDKMQAHLQEIVERHRLAGLPHGIGRRISMQKGA
ncbi:thioesterase family protein [Tardiphaga sp. 215_C5_N2_1]|uniref:thioesterase family protein n=1 Tax=Tardiphaga sp. 215_C5_N2_1 TaxID=3240774 RepID=UPI003F8AAB87